MERLNHLLDSTGTASGAYLLLCGTVALGAIGAFTGFGGAMEASLAGNAGGAADAGQVNGSDSNSGSNNSNGSDSSGGAHGGSDPHGPSAGSGAVALSDQAGLLRFGKPVRNLGRLSNLRIADDVAAATWGHIAESLSHDAVQAYAKQRRLDPKIRVHALAPGAGASRIDVKGGKGLFRRARIDIHGIPTPDELLAALRTYGDARGKARTADEFAQNPLAGLRIRNAEGLAEGQLENLATHLRSLDEGDRAFFSRKLDTVQIVSDRTGDELSRVKYSRGKLKIWTNRSGELRFGGDTVADRVGLLPSLGRLRVYRADDARKLRRFRTPFVAAAYAAGAPVVAVAGLAFLNAF
ncbi:MAG: hypothetical protein KC416_06955 [Myxococcales bacterium]|nr:hypothetical protein [Myxococcales bacterium]